MFGPLRIGVAWRCTGCDNAELDLLKAFLQQHVLSLVHILHFNVSIEFLAERRPWVGGNQCRSPHSLDIGVSPNIDGKVPNGEVPEKRKTVKNDSEICHVLTPFNFFT